MLLLVSVDSAAAHLLETLTNIETVSVRHGRRIEARHEIRHVVKSCSRKGKIMRYSEMQHRLDREE
ncbi:MAG: hypothetical protein JWN36_523 [Microbacteriaceae bacterium]|nr:hypothetical protein [Microbacteriaceae bacterium]